MDADRVPYNDSFNKVVLVTGGTGSIGQAITQYYLSQGWKTIVISRGYNNTFKESQFLEDYPENFYSFKADLTKSENLKETYDFISRRYGKLNLLINCAGGLCTEEDIRTTEPDCFLNVFKLNVMSTYNTCNKFMNLIINAKGVIVNFSGGGAIADQSNGEFISYPVAKTALLRLTEILANQLLKFGIEVYAIDPGWVPSEEDWKKINSSTSPKNLINLSYVSNAGSTPALIDYLYKNRDHSLSGKLFSVLDDYKSVIYKLKHLHNTDSLKLRLLKV